MINSKKNIVVAIDGEPGTGKSSLAKCVAEKLGILYIDTGAMYRALGLYFLQHDITVTEDAMKQYQSDIHITFEYKEKIEVLLNGEKVTDRIRSTEVSKMASKVSRVLAVREFLVAEQRKLAKNQSVIMDGQDIGTVVFPEATLKIYLTASIEERARRRHCDLVAKGENISVEQVKQDLLERAQADLTRENSPILKAKDAYELDSTTHSVTKLAEHVITLLKEKRGKLS